MNIKKVGLFALACISAASVAAPLALAQSAPSTGDQSGGAATDTLQEVVVSGLRQSLDQAQMIKSLNPDVVDAIVAQDIGKFPDNTVGDALQRVPGVQVTRNADQIIGVNIRGLPNVETTLNGDEIFTTNLRTFDFQNMPAEALAGVDVYKTSSADQIEGGIAGLIDVRTHRPFDFQGFEAAGSATDQYDSMADSHNPVVNALVSDRWQTDVGEFGALVNGSFSREQYDYPVVWEDTPHNPEPTSQTGYRACRVIRALQGSETTIGERKYPEINVALQFKPSDSLEFYSDHIYTGYTPPRYGSSFFFTVTSDPHPLSDVTLAGLHDADRRLRLPGGIGDGRRHRQLSRTRRPARRLSTRLRPISIPTSGSSTSRGPGRSARRSTALSRGSISARRSSTRASMTKP